MNKKLEKRKTKSVRIEEHLHTELKFFLAGHPAEDMISVLGKSTTEYLVANGHKFMGKSKKQ